MIKQLINTEIFKMSSVIRYSWTKTNNPENLAEHSYYVIVFSDSIAEDLEKKYKLDIDRYAVMKYATYHDVEEIFTWDIITPVKYKDESLRKKLENIGELLLTEWLEENFKENPHIKENILKAFHWYEDNKYDKIENQIVKFADQLEAFSYCISELRLWNTNFYDIAITVLLNIKERWDTHKYFSSYIKEIDLFFYDKFKRK